MLFSLFVASVAMASYVPSVKMYASSFLVGTSNGIQASEQPGRLITSVSPVEDYKNYSANVRLAGDPVRGFAFPGGENAKVMDFVLKSFDANLNLEFVSFKIGGVDPSKIRKVYLADEKHRIAETSVRLGYANFYGLFLNIPAGTEKKLSVSVDLSNDVSLGDRVYFTIEKKDDIRLFANGEEYVFGDIFPLERVYLSIVKPRGK